jgi:hypothetical protein
MSNGINIKDENLREIHELRKKIYHLETHVQSLENAIEKRKYNEKKYLNFFNAIPIPILLIELDAFVIVDCNDEFVADYNINKHDITYNYSPSDFIPDISVILEKNVEHSLIKMPYVHRINNQERFVDLTMSTFQSEESHFLLLLISLKNNQE